MRNYQVECAQCHETEWNSLPDECFYCGGHDVIVRDEVAEEEWELEENFS